MDEMIIEVRTSKQLQVSSGKTRTRKGQSSTVGGFSNISLAVDEYLNTIKYNALQLAVTQ